MLYLLYFLLLIFMYNHLFMQMYSSDVYMSYLPLAHIFDRVIEELFIYNGGSIGFWRGVWEFIGINLTWWSIYLLVEWKINTTNFILGELFICRTWSYYLRILRCSNQHSFVQFHVSWIVFIQVNYLFLRSSIRNFALVPAISSLMSILELSSPKFLMDTFLFWCFK